MTAPSGSGLGASPNWLHRLNNIFADLFPVLDNLLGSGIVQEMLYWRVRVNKGRTLWYGTPPVPKRSYEQWATLLDVEQPKITRALKDAEASLQQEAYLLKTRNLPTSRDALEVDKFAARSRSVERCGEVREGEEQDTMQQLNKMQALLYELVQDLFSVGLLRPWENVNELQNLRLVDEEKYDEE